MGHPYTVLGSGRQGAAIAYDLVLNGEASSVTIADSDLPLAKTTAQRINMLTNKACLKAVACDGASVESLREVIKGSQVVVSALPYFLNLNAVRAAVHEKAHFSDLGGNTEIVLQELEFDRQAQEAGISVLPDCGLAPGLSNLLAAHSIQSIPNVHTVRVRCGGLPQIPRPPLHYKMVFSLDGLINEYSGFATALRDGALVKIQALTEPETLEIPGQGTFEAYVTTGGTSTAPFTFQGRLKNFDYKTLRYPGHFEQFRAFEALGLFSEKPIYFGNEKIIPRKLLFSLLKPLIDFPLDRDRVILVVDAEGEKNGRTPTYRALVVDEGDSEGRFTAMERTTGFPTAVIAHLQARGAIAPGATPIEKAVPLDPFLEGLKKRGLSLEITTHD